LTGYIRGEWGGGGGGSPGKFDFILYSVTKGSQLWITGDNPSGLVLCNKLLNLYFILQRSEIYSLRVHVIWLGFGGHDTLSITLSAWSLPDNGANSKDLQSLYISINLYQWNSIAINGQRL
jgi:hypothetical protein